MSWTSIEWTDTTWNPTRGCSPISPGCKNCYAEKIAGRFCKDDLTNHNEGDQPFHGFAIMKNHKAHWTGKLDLIESKLLEPLHWRKPRRVFVNSMSDLFHENLPTRAIVRTFAVMTLTPWITYQILTKRANRLPMVIDAQFEHDVKGCAWEMLGRMPKFNHQYLNSNAMTRPWPLPNVHLGVSIEDPDMATLRIPQLLRTPAALRFISYEPALEGVDLRPLLVRKCSRCGGSHRGRLNENPCSWCAERGHTAVTIGLDWVIIGGESGPDARPFNLEWARTTIRQCKEAGVPVFLKQLGSRPFQWTTFGHIAGESRHFLTLKDKKGGDMEEWPDDLKIREFPKAA